MTCVVCGSMLEEQREVLTICKKRECKKVLESLVVGDYVVSWLRDKTELAHIHLMLGYKAFRSQRWKLIAHPSPVYFDNHDDLLGAMISFNELFKEAHDNDEQLVRRIGEPSYVLIKFILMTAPSLTVIDSPDNCKILAVPNANSQNLVFHGSSEENWYSIIRNGLKICSGTAWQKHGARYGKGVYLGKILSVSCGYTGGDQVIGVYNAENIISRSGSILVAKDNSCIKLQYVIIAKNLPVELQRKIEKCLKKQ